mgnify:CR=1 FL=1
MENWNIKIIDEGYRIDRAVYIFRKLGDKTEIFRGKTLEIIEFEAITEPSFYMSPEMLQEFANALDKNGISPKQGFVEGKREATEKHLDDMRKIVFAPTITQDNK